MVLGDVVAYLVALALPVWLLCRAGRPLDGGVTRRASSAASFAPSARSVEVPRP